MTDLNCQHIIIICIHIHSIAALSLCRIFALEMSVMIRPLALVMCIQKTAGMNHIIGYNLFSFHISIQDYIIHMDMEIIIYVGIKR